PFQAPENIARTYTLRGKHNPRHQSQLAIARRHAGKPKPAPRELSQIMKAEIHIIQPYEIVVWATARRFRCKATGKRLRDHRTPVVYRERSDLRDRRGLQSARRRPAGPAGGQTGWRSSGWE